MNTITRTQASKAILTLFILMVSLVLTGTQGRDCVFAADDGIVHEVEFSLADFSFTHLRGYDVVKLKSGIVTRKVGSPQMPYPDAI